MRSRGGSTEGAALLEAAVVMPFVVVLMLNVVNFGMYVQAWVTLNNAARALLQYRVYAGVVLGYPPAPSVAQMQNLVTAEVSSLPNKMSVTWGVCSNANGTTTCEGPAGPFGVDPDPVQPTHYRLFSAKVWYSFQPLFPGLTLPLGYTVAGFPTGSVSRQASMRSMQ